MFHYNSGKQWKSKKNREEISKWARFYYRREDKVNIKEKEKYG